MSPKAAKKTTQSSRSLEVGDEVDAKCTKCKDVTKHLVLAKVGWKPTRVECKTCGGAHQYRAPSTAKKKAPAAPTLSPEEQWKALMKNAKGPAVKYDRSAEYAVGTLLDHTNFGQGVVFNLSTETVCEVAFELGTKKLLMGSRGATRPG